MSIQAPEFLLSTLDAIKDHIVVIDGSGAILYTNRAWNNFSHDNGNQDTQWESVNYLDVCQKASQSGDKYAKLAIDGIYTVIRDERPEFYLEYPCHSPLNKRWFMMQVTSFVTENHKHFVISHRNITQRKLAEESIQTLSQTDPLTQLYNRRYFNEYLDLEWQRCSRLQTPLSLAIVDIDYFKILNDTYGHSHGDQCLQEIAHVFRKLTQRPSDICARYGGEEFILVYGNTDSEHALKLLTHVISSIRQLKIPNKNSPTVPYVTVSIGLSTTFPSIKTSKAHLIDAADKMLYTAKDRGRNQLICEQMHFQAAHYSSPASIHNISQT